MRTDSDDDPYGIIDEWMGAVSDAKSHDAESNVNNGARIGLGKKVKAGKKDNLEDRLDHRNKQKQKKLKNLEGEDSYEGPLHGIVEEEEISKFTSSKTTNKAVEPEEDTGVLLSTKPTKVTNVKSDSNSTSKKEDNYDITTMKSDIKVVTSSSSSNKQFESKNHQAPTVASSTNATIHNPQTSNSTEPFQRKKTKTRSKQKNIRRDTRPDDQRPAHLRLHVEEYQGRALTKETVSRLGLKN